MSGEPADAEIDLMLNAVRKEAQLRLLAQLQGHFANADAATLIGANYTAGEWSIADVRTGARRHLQTLINNITQHGPL